MFHAPLHALAALALHDDRYTPVLAIPFISFALAWLERKTVFAGTRNSFTIGLPMMLAAAASFVAAPFLKPTPEHLLSLQVAAILLLIVGLFISCYGRNAFLAALFPLIFLFLMAPMPDSTLNHAVVILQRASAEMAYSLFKLAGIPVLREGTVKSLFPVLRSRSHRSAVESGLVYPY